MMGWVLGNWEKYLIISLARPTRPCLSVVARLGTSINFEVGFLIWQFFGGKTLLVKFIGPL
jgi:hypothetical protein